jgi:hypothetical protein
MFSLFQTFGAYSTFYVYYTDNQKPSLKVIQQITKASFHNVGARLVQSTKTTFTLKKGLLCICFHCNGNKDI